MTHYVIACNINFHIALDDVNRSLISYHIAPLMSVPCLVAIKGVFTILKGSGKKNLIRFERDS